jgi:hypothetical protein
MTNIIMAGRFDSEKEYEEIKLPSIKKTVFSQAFTPRKSVIFFREGGDCRRAGGGPRSLVIYSESAETTPAGV